MRDDFGGSLISCAKSAVTDRCAYTKNLKTNETWQDCIGYVAEKDRNNTGKCIKTNTEYVYLCNTTFCNNAHVCDQLELGKPSPFGAPTSASGPGESPAVSTPKNTGSCFNLPAIVMSVLVVVICFTV
uniref:Activin_recp domain-containing protein n=1 Tax=Panagrellus redivivus TaxID=6233 RepID=A0A7E4ZT40_PANRE